MLLTKAELNLAKLAPKQESRYALQGIAVQTKHSVITDGHILVAVTHTEMKEENYPLTAGLEHKKLENGAVSETVLVSSSAAIAAVKALPKKPNVPILANAALGTDKALYVNNLDSVQSFKSELAGTFPRWEAIVPTKKPQAEFLVNAELLESIAKYIRENGSDVPCVRVTVYDAETAIRFDAHTGTGEEIMSLLMPMRNMGREFAKRPHEVKKAEPPAEAPKAE